MIVLIDYGAGNTKSVSTVLNELKADFILTNDRFTIQNANKIILPGVGEASSAMNKLKDLDLIETIKSASTPFLGICLGMQLLCSRTEEGNTECLGIINSEVKVLPGNLKVPHMGWNNIEHNNNTLFTGINNKEYFYFAHSFYIPENEYSTSGCSYGINFCSSINYKNYYGVQFHPEKSSRQGVQLIKNFLEL
jgi:imidazole glycerol-phosphate synthase subunit HisH